MFWDMLQRMASDRLWIYTAIAGAIISAIVVAYLRTTRVGIWVYEQFDKLVDYLITRWKLSWLTQPEDAWKKNYPEISAKFDELEARIKNLENR